MSEQTANTQEVDHVASGELETQVATQEHQANSEQTARDLGQVANRDGSKPLEKLAQRADGSWDYESVIVAENHRGENEGPYGKSGRR